MAVFILKWVWMMWKVDQEKEARRNLKEEHTSELASLNNQLDSLKKQVEEEQARSKKLEKNLAQTSQQLQEARRKAEEVKSGQVATLEEMKKWQSIAVANPRAHRRSRSTDAALWLDHRPTDGGPIMSNTVMQPVIPKRKSVNKLEVADVVNEKTSKYLLTDNTQDQQGRTTTKLYTGDINPTVGGGARVVFEDVEVLTQESPEKQDRKRSFEGFRGLFRGWERRP